MQPETYMHLGLAAGRPQRREDGRQPCSGSTPVIKKRPFRRLVLATILGDWCLTAPVLGPARWCSPWTRWIWTSVSDPPRPEIAVLRSSRNEAAGCSGKGKLGYLYAERRQTLEIGDGSQQ